MKKRIAIALTLVLAVGALVAAPLVLADGPGGHFRGGMGGHALGHGFGPLARLMHVKEELDLSEEQVDRIKDIFAETRVQTAPYRKQLHGGYEGVAKALLANPDDVAGAQALIDQQTNAERAMKASILNGASKALAVLTPEQRAKLGTMVAEHVERHGRHGRHGR
ncbi:MAG TPA: Spy/CpxP family protein refolding chaperone [Thermoanaerobaculia bacterium]